MERNFLNSSYEQRKADAKQAIDESFCGVLIAHHGNPDRWIVKGYTEVGYENGILEAMSIACDRAMGGVEVLLDE